MKTKQANKQIEELGAPDGLLTSKALVKKLGISRSTISNLVKARILPAVRIGRTLRFDPKDVDAYIAQCKEGPDVT